MLPKDKIINYKNKLYYGNNTKEVIIGNNNYVPYKHTTVYQTTVNYSGTTQFPTTISNILTLDIDLSQFAYFILTVSSDLTYTFSNPYGKVGTWKTYIQCPSIFSDYTIATVWTSTYTSQSSYNIRFYNQGENITYIVDNRAIYMSNSSKQWWSSSIVSKPSIQLYAVHETAASGTRDLTITGSLSVYVHGLIYLA